jgi:hypothetical protein
MADKTGAEPANAAKAPFSISIYGCFQLITKMVWPEG